MYTSNSHSQWRFHVWNRLYILRLVGTLCSITLYQSVERQRLVRVDLRLRSFNAPLPLVVGLLVLADLVASGYKCHISLYKLINYLFASNQAHMSYPANRGKKGCIRGIVKWNVDSIIPQKTNSLRCIASVVLLRQCLVLSGRIWPNFCLDWVL